MTCDLFHEDRTFDDMAHFGKVAGVGLGQASCLPCLFTFLNAQR